MRRTSHLKQSDPTYQDLENRIQDLEEQLTSLQSCTDDALSARNAYQGFLEFLPYPVLVRDLNEKITYLNPAFTRTFKWTLDELEGTQGKQYVPPYLRTQLNTKIKAMLNSDSDLRMSTRRLTKDGRTLKVALRVGIQKDRNGSPTSLITVLRDITMEDRIDKNREAMNRISMALPQYPELPKLLSYITMEIKDLLKVQVANVVLLDETSEEFYFLSSAHDDPYTQKKIEKLRLSVDDMISGQVLKTGKPMIVIETSDLSRSYQLRDQKLGYEVKNVLLVPLRIQDRIIGVLTADNKKEGQFDQTDLETLSTIAGTVALSIENARVNEELRKTYEDLKALNSAKDKMINHLSHELKTPLAIMLSSVSVLSRRLETLPDRHWEQTLDRIKRNLKRILEIQYEVDDIVKQKNPLHRNVFSLVLEQCADEIASLVAEHTGEGEVVQKVRGVIEDTFFPKDLESENIELDRFVHERLQILEKQFTHRRLDITPRLEPSFPVKIPAEPLRKMIDGLIRNAVENTPDGGDIVIRVAPQEQGTGFIITDHGTGITPDAQKHIFEGFLSTQDTLQYSSKRPFDFNAGGKGADLLRMKIFSERYNFKIGLSSTRCRHIPENADSCPGSTEQCRQLSLPNWPGCNGTTTVTLWFPA
ncbi:MAG: GAF domain-containing protein [Desulfobacteraceae bacterium]|nr:MAG: GAF domain-containing protein [Desulfobacteraceae bacterium]